jgi:3-phosphoshikimate 1-carboxyvinyltransferase
MNFTVSLKQDHIVPDATIHLTGSKSESNRALIIAALSNGLVKINNLSSAADTVTLSAILNSFNQDTNIKEVNVGPAGTAMRFLTAYLSLKGLPITITGSDRMKQRPIGTLVNALKTLGANLFYIENDGFPPVSIHGALDQQTKDVLIRGDISSQFLTALLLIASSLPLGIKLEIMDELTSKPYVDMTLSMLNQCGISHTWDGDVITIEPQDFKENTLTIEPDWSAASYWYSMVALSEKAKITLPYLKKDSLQGDSAIADIMEIFGVKTTYLENGIEIEKVDQEIKPQLINFKECPDLAQTVVVCAALLGKEFSFEGLETLKIKETDRILALQTELAKIGVKLIETQADVYQLFCDEIELPESITIATYEDHRMAMAFAPMAVKIKNVLIEEAMVVEKSYPLFWEDLKKLGFDVSSKT